MDDTLTYSKHLHLDDLLCTQRPQSKEHDEWLFIAVHQSHEIWFKQILLEIDFLNKQFMSDESHDIQRTLHRIIRIFQMFLHKIEILKTMLPTSFVRFRGALGTASGLQSCQFREVEFMLGFKSQRILNYLKTKEDTTKLQERYFNKAIWDYFLIYLERCGMSIPHEALSRDITQAVLANKEIQALVKEIYLTNSPHIDIIELLLDLDQLFQEWRYRHVNLVRRTIGINAPGTAQTSGFDYLKASVFQMSFPDLWIVRPDFFQN